MRNKLTHLMVTFFMFKWYALLHYKEIPTIYWMTLVVVWHRFFIYALLTLSYKIYYAIMHLLHNKHTLHSFSTNLSFNVMKRFQQK